ncbi:MAG: 3-oxoacyl-ACP reductase FabG [Planctomycetota bacterium]|jgi:3-oxoacyl-[acyl-carrier protein] reductase
MSDQRKVLVTGASRGIGRAVAEHLGRAGFHVAVHYRSGADLAEEVAEGIRSSGGSAETLGFDVADREATGAALAEAISDGAFWGVVSNAGVTADAPLASLAPDDWDRVLRTNLDGFYNVVQPLVMPMVRLRQGGRIVAMSSITGLAGNAGQTNYAASKGGLIAASKSLAFELAKRKVTVNAVCPGFVATEMVEGLDESAVLDRVPMRRMGTADEVASLVGYLFSDGAAYITAQAISINGGMA